jgi:hypothetical protein
MKFDYETYEQDKQKSKEIHIEKPYRYIMGCDPYDGLNWFQTLLKKTGFFYKNRPKSSVGVFRWKEDGSVEFVKDCL